MATWRLALLAGLLAIYPTLPLVAGEPARILLVHSFGPAVAPFDDYVRQLKENMSRQHAALEFIEVVVPGDEANETFIQHLNVVAGQQLPDMVITIGAVAARFLQLNRKNIFQSVPVLITAVDEQIVDRSALMPKDAMVATRLDLPAIIEGILTLLPNTTHIAVVIGSSPLERYWLERTRREFERFAGRVDFIWMNGLTLGEMITRSATLPKNSAIFFGILWFDAAGLAYAKDRPFTAIHAVAEAPMFSFSDSFLGRGLVGGPMLSIEKLSREVAVAASARLSGKASNAARTQVLGFADPVFDWRELQRWNIEESQLPSGSRVKFREPGPWTLYRWQIISAIALMLAQATLIHWLLTEYRKRRASETSAHHLTQKLIAVQEEERARLARELHDDVTQRLAVLAIEAGSGEKAVSCEAGRSTMQSIRRALVRLSEDIHALAYSLHPSLLKDLGLREALKTECAQFVQTCSIRLQLNADELADRVPLDVGLCIFRIVQESLRNTARHASANQVNVSLRAKHGGLQLTVADDGVGFDPSLGKNGARLGHASMRQRIALLHGTLEIDSRPGWGTAVTAWVPLDMSASG